MSFYCYTYDCPDPISKPEWLARFKDLDVTFVRIVVRSFIILSKGHGFNFEADDALMPFKGSMGVNRDV